MLAFWICVTIGGLLLLGITLTDGWEGFLVHIPATILGMLIGAVLSILIFLCVSMVADREEYLRSEERIYALQDNKGTNGKFFLGSGRVDGSLKYNYLIDTTRGKKIKEKDIDDAYIVEDNNIAPKVEHYYSRFENKILRKLYGGDDLYEYSRFFIPENSIKENYNIDLE